MAEREGLYIVKLEFSTENVGGGSMTLQLGVDPVHNSLHGRADGTVLEGTEYPPNFTADASGTYHHTGLGEVTMVGGVKGQAAISASSGDLGTYLAPFSASFAVDNDWNGTGKFTVGQYTYECTVKNVEALVPA